MKDIRLDPATLFAMLQGDEEAKAKLLEVAQEAVDAQATKEISEGAEYDITTTVVAWKERVIDEILPPLCVKLLKAQFEWHPETAMFVLSKRGLYVEYASDMASEEMIGLLRAINDAENTDDLILEDMAAFAVERLGQERYDEILSQSEWPVVQKVISSLLAVSHSSTFHSAVEITDGKIGGQAKAVITLLYNAVGVGDMPGWSINVKLGQAAKKSANGHRIANGSGKRVSLKEEGFNTIRDYFLDTFVRNGCLHADEKAQALVVEHGEKSNKYNYINLILRAEESIPENERLYTNAKAALV